MRAGEALQTVRKELKKKLRDAKQLWRGKVEHKSKQNNIKEVEWDGKKGKKTHTLVEIRNLPVS